MFLQWMGAARRIGGLALDVKFERVELMLWPSAAFNLASQEPSPFGPVDLPLVAALVTNVILYCVLGLLLWAGLNRSRIFFLPLVAIVALIWWRMWTLFNMGGA
jgi:hypothetical protein